MEHVYINSDGHLYARTNIDTLRKYTAGIFPVNINFQSSYQYKKQSKKGNLNVCHVSMPNSKDDDFSEVDS